MADVSKDMIKRFAEKQTKDSMALEYSGEILEGEVVDNYIYVEYSSNNSGGGWWLDDEDWFKLADAGWEVEWIKEPGVGDFLTNRSYDNPRPVVTDDVYRWLGALATAARKRVPDRSYEGETISEWERLTGQNQEDEGCSCCGPPHYFSFKGPQGEYIW